MWQTHHQWHTQMTPYCMRTCNARDPNTLPPESKPLSQATMVSKLLSSLASVEQQVLDMPQDLPLCLHCVLPFSGPNSKTCQSSFVTWPFCKALAVIASCARGEPWLIIDFGNPLSSCLVAELLSASSASSLLPMPARLEPPLSNSSEFLPVNLWQLAICSFPDP